MDQLPTTGSVAPIKKVAGIINSVAARNSMKCNAVLDPEDRLNRIG